MDTRTTHHTQRTSVSVLQCCPADGVLTTLTAVGLATNAVHGNGNGLVGLCCCGETGAEGVMCGGQRGALVSTTPHLSANATGWSCLNSQHSCTNSWHPTTSRPCLASLGPRHAPHYHTVTLSLTSLLMAPRLMPPVQKRFMISAASSTSSMLMGDLPACVCTYIQASEMMSDV